MPLRATKPEAVSRRLKLLMFSPAGVGKTTAAIQFPRPYVIDTEKGTVEPEYGAMIETAGGAVYQCPDLDDATKETKTLLSEQHDFQTYVLDSFTKPYLDECDRQELRVGNDWQAHIKAADKVSRRLFSLIMRLDMNVIVTAHAKSEWKNGAATGDNTFEGWKKLDYLFDLVLELSRDKKKKDQRIATVRKTRIKAFPDGASFLWSFGEIARRYPLAASGLQATPSPFPSPEELALFRQLVAVYPLPPGTLEKWLAKAEVDNIEDMPRDKFLKCIDWMQANANAASRLTQLNGAHA